MSDAIMRALLEALSEVNRPATFCVAGKLPAALPGLEVAGVGPVALPLGKAQAAKLKKQARQAPYGKGEQTVVDTSVRRVWEFDADQLKLANPQWPPVVTQAVDTVKSELGLDKRTLRVHLYKLLLYEPGSFFVSHRDGERLDGMVATLVIALPSEHTGGELVVRHEGLEKVIDFGPEGRFQTQFAAFYADCDHEVRPVTSGYRLTLVYNLTLEKSRPAIGAPSIGQNVTALARVLEQWKKVGRKSADSQTGPAKLAVLLDHCYTEAGLRYDALKGTDRAKADALFAAASQAGCDAFLALVTYWETGAADEGAYGADHGRGRYHHYEYEYADDEDDDEDEDDRGRHKIEEVFDQSLTAEHFSDAGGHTLSFGKVPMAQSELVSKTPLNKGKPDKEDLQGYTGNEGLTLDRWYHRAGIVVWPAEARFDVLCSAGMDFAVGGLESMVRHWAAAEKDEQPRLKPACVEFARRIITHWPARTLVSRWEYRAEPDEPRRTRLLPLLKKLNEPSLISAWIHGVLARDVSVVPDKTLGAICQQHGWTTFAAELKRLFAGTSNETVERHAKLLADFSLRKDKDGARIAICRELGEVLMSFIERWNPRPSERQWDARPLDASALLPPLVQSFVTPDAPDLLDRLVSYVLDRPREFDLTTVLVPTLVSLEKWLRSEVGRSSPPLRRWLVALREELESRVAHPPQAPTDFRRESAPGCGCPLCGKLRQFLADPAARTLRLPLSKERRQHLHQVIERARLDTTHATERRGRPYTLVCTKNDASYQRALQAHQTDLRQLAQVRKLLTWYDRLV